MYFVLETMQARREWSKTGKVLKRTPQPRILYIAKLSLKSEREIKTFHNFLFRQIKAWNLSPAEVLAEGKGYGQKTQSTLRKEEYQRRNK